MPSSPESGLMRPVVRRSRQAADKIASLKPHRASYPSTDGSATVFNSSFGSSVHSSSSNVSIERLTATDDEVSPLEHMEVGLGWVRSGQVRFG